MCTRLIVNISQVYTPLYLVDSLNLAKVRSVAGVGGREGGGEGGREGGGRGEGGREGGGGEGGREGGREG